MHFSETGKAETSGDQVMNKPTCVVRLEKRLECYLKLQDHLDNKTLPSKRHAIPLEEQEIFLEGIQQGLRMALDLIEEDDSAHEVS